MLMKIIVDFIVAILVLIAAISVQFLTVPPIFVFPESLPLDAPKRSDFVETWIFTLVVAVVPALIIALYSDLIVKERSFQNYAYPVLYYLTAVSVASLLCSGVHFLLGTPRPDSIAQCRTVNVTYWACSLALSKPRLASQFRSFPSTEAAVSMAAAVMINSLLVSPQTRFSELVPIIAKSIPLCWAVMIGAFCVALSMYRIYDIVAGYFIGYVVASWAANAYHVESQNRGEVAPDPDGQYNKANI